jgi:hypothetical protein
LRHSASVGPPGSMGRRSYAGRPLEGSQEFGTFSLGRTCPLLPRRPSPRLNYEIFWDCVPGVESTFSFFALDYLGQCGKLRELRRAGMHDATDIFRPRGRTSADPPQHQATSDLLGALGTALPRLSSLGPKPCDKRAAVGHIKPTEVAFG